MASSPLRVAIWQCESHPLDVSGNLSRLEEACRRAATEQADVLVTPEMFTTGYAIGPEDTRRLAEPSSGPTARAVADITHSTGVAVAYGYPEQGPNDTTYNAVQLIDTAKVRGHHRKLHLFSDLDKNRFTRGNTTPQVFELRGHRVAMLVCYDVEFPESVRHAALQGATTVLVPTANMAGYEIVSTILVRARAYENGLYVAYANYCGAEGDIQYGGLSTVCPPNAEELPLLAGTEEALLVVELSNAPTAPPYLADRRADLWSRHPLNEFQHGVRPA